MRGHRNVGRVILTILILTILAGALGALWIYNGQIQSRRAQELQMKALELQAEDSSQQATTKDESSLADVADESTEESADTLFGEKITDESSGADASETVAPTEPVTSINTISCRGDAFNEDGSDKTTGYPAKLQSLLTSAGINMTVQDNTWGMAGTLSQLRFAGVSEDTVNAYIAKHQANGQTGSVFETKVRDDLATAMTERTDADAIPVIFMGYYGGWGNDFSELIQQINDMLSTYNQQEKYVVVGLHPYYTTDAAGYDAALSGAFGEHYLSMDDKVTTAVMSDAARGQMAQALFDKMMELGYLE